jgi:ABC-2 type transport system ATP-binding protein
MLEVRELHKRFGTAVALDGCSLAAERGRVLGFLGANGSGKTTTMRAVFGLVRLDSGVIAWEGRPVRADERVRFGYMPEERGLYPRMPVGEQLTYLARLHGMAEREAAMSADRWLARLGLRERATALLEELSHGNQLRVQLAAALVHDPVLVMLDEPFAGLDPIGVEAMRDIVREQAERGRAIVFSSHQLDLVESLCDDVAILHRGRDVLAGDLGDLRRRSGHRRVQIAFDPDGRRTVDRSVPADADVGRLVRDAQRDGDINRFSYAPPRLSDLYREAVAA